MPLSFRDMEEERRKREEEKRRADMSYRNLLPTLQAQYSTGVSAKKTPPSVSSYGGNLTPAQKARQGGTQQLLPNAKAVKKAAGVSSPKKTIPAYGSNLTAAQKARQEGTQLPLAKKSPKPLPVPRKNLWETAAEGLNSANSGGRSVKYQRPGSYALPTKTKLPAMMTQASQGIAAGYNLGSPKPMPLPTARQLGYGGSRAAAGLLQVAEGIGDFTMSHLADVTAGMTAYHGGDIQLLRKQQQENSQDFTDMAKKYLSNSVTRDYLEKTNAKYNPTPIEQEVGDFIQMGTAMIPTIGAGVINPLLGKLVLGTQVAGNAGQQAYMEGADLEKAKAYGLLSGGLEVGIESLFGGIPKLGEGFADMAGSKLLGKLADKFGGETAQKIFRAIGSEAAKKGVDILGEGVEEAVSAFLDPYLQRLTYNENAPAAALQDMVKAGVSGALMAGVFQGAAYGVNKALGAVQPKPLPVPGRATIEPINVEAKDVYQRALGKQQELLRGIEESLINTKAFIVDGGAKSVDSIVNKVVRKQEAGENYGIASMKDHARAAILAQDFTDIPNIIEALKKRFPDLTGEAFIDVPLNNTGYRGIHLTLPMGEGINAEIQISTPEAWNIKKQTDTIYEQWRNVNREQMTEEDILQKIADDNRSKSLWEEYYAGITPEVKREASSAVMGLASSHVPSMPLYGAQVPFLNSNSGIPLAAANNLPPSDMENSNMNVPPRKFVVPNSSIPDSPANGNPQPLPIPEQQTTLRVGNRTPQPLPIPEQNVAPLPVPGQTAPNPQPLPMPDGALTSPVRLGRMEVPNTVVEGAQGYGIQQTPQTLYGDDPRRNTGAPEGSESSRGRGNDGRGSAGSNDVRSPGDLSGMEGDGKTAPKGFDLRRQGENTSLLRTTSQGERIETRFKEIRPETYTPQQQAIAQQGLADGVQVFFFDGPVYKLTDGKETQLLIGGEYQPGGVILLDSSGRSYQHELCHHMQQVIPEAAKNHVQEIQFLTDYSNPEVREHIALLIEKYQSVRSTYNEYTIWKELAARVFNPNGGDNWETFFVDYEAAMEANGKLRQAFEDYKRTGSDRPGGNLPPQGAGNRTPQPLPIPGQASVAEAAMQGVEASAAPFEQVRSIAQKLGVEVEFSDRLGEGVHGKYEDGKIYISQDSAQPVLEVFKHELTHHLESSGHYQTLQDFILNGEYLHKTLADSGITLEQLRQAIMDDYAARGVQLDTEGANRELVAKFVEDRLFTSEADIQRLANTNPSLAQRIYRWITDTLAKVRGTQEERFFIEARAKYERALRTAQNGEGRSAQYLFVPPTDPKALAKAQWMEAEGFSFEEIWKETGLGRGADGQWRTELDDSQARYFPAGNSYLQDNPDYQRYRELNTKAYGNEAMAAGEHQELARLMGKPELMGPSPFPMQEYTLSDYMSHPELYQRYPDIASLPVVKDRNLWNMDGGYSRDSIRLLDYGDWGKVPQERGTLLHEIQHAVQDREGFASGSSVDYWQRRLAEEQGGGTATLTQDPKTLYRNTAGEIEARLTNDRKDMTAEQRRQNPPDFGKDRAVFAKDAIEAMSINPQFTHEYDAWDKKRTGGYFKLGTTSQALQSIGIDPAIISWDKTKILAIKNKHLGMTDDVIKQVPYILENPVIVMQSQTVLNRVVMLGEVYDTSGNPVLCALELKPNGNINDVVKMTSAHSRTGKQVQYLLDTSDILYIDPNKKRTNSWLQPLRLQLPAGATNYGSLGKVTYYEDVVKGQGTAKTAIELALEKAIADKDGRNSMGDSFDQYLRKLSSKEGSQSGYGPNTAGPVPLVAPELTKTVSQTQGTVQSNAPSIRDMVKNIPNSEYQIPQLATPARLFVDDAGNPIPLSKYPAAIQRYLNKTFRGKVLQIGSDHKVYINGTGIKEFSYPANRRMDSDLKTAKYVAGASLDKTLEPAMYLLNTPDDGRHPAATGGWDNFYVMFKTDGGVYSGIVKTMNTDKGRLFYDITEIKKEDMQPATYDVNGTNPPPATQSISSNQSITDIPGNIKAQEKLSYGSNTVGAAQAAVPQSPAQLVKRHGAIPPGEQPRARKIQIPKETSGGKTMRFARTAAEAGTVTDKMAGSIAQEVAEGTFSYTPVGDKYSIAQANTRLGSLGLEGAYNQWRVLFDGGKRIGKEDIALAERLVQEAAKAGDSERVMSLIADIAAVGTDSGQNVQALSMFKRLTPEGQILSLQRNLNRLNSENGGRARTAKRMEQVNGLKGQLAQAKAQGNSGVVEQLQKQLLKLNGELYLPQECVQDILSQTTPEGLEQARMRALEKIAEQVPANFWDKFNAWRYTAMLLNPRTHAKNVTSNTIFGTTVQLKDIVGTGVETAAAKVLPGIERSKSILNPLEETDRSLLQFAKQDYGNVGKALTSGEKNTTAAILNQHRKIFNTPWLESIRKNNSAALELEDAIFKQRAYINSLAQYLKANKVTGETVPADMLDRARQYAAKEALKATFQDANAVSNALNRLKHINTATEIIGGGLFPFTKTPLNIAKRGVEYSPLGVLKSIYDGFAKVHTGKMEAVEMLDELSSGLTGTGIMILGAWMSSQGWLTGGGSDDKKEGILEKLKGNQQYALKIGDKSYTLEWMAPTAIPLFVGVELEHSLRDGSGSITALLDNLTKIDEPLFNMTCLTNFNHAIKSAAYGNNPLTDMAVETVTNYFSQATPAPLAAVSRTVDGTRRNPYYVDKNSPLPEAAQLFINKTKAKIPGLSQALPAYVDQWGRTSEVKPLPVRAVENFISPGYLSTIREEPATMEVERLYHELGESGVLPKTASKNLNYAGEKYWLTGEEYVDWQTLQGQASHELVRNVISLPIYKSMEDSDKEETLERIYGYARELAKEGFMESRDIPYKDGDDGVKLLERVKEAEKVGLSPEEYFALKQGISNAEGRKDFITGKTISGSVKQAKMQYLMNQGFNYTEAMRLYEILG